MSTKRSILIWGLAVGAVSIGLMLASMPLGERLGFEYSMAIGYTALILSALLIYPGVRSYRDRVASGRMTFGRGFLVGLGIAAVAAVTYVAIWEVVYFTFMPDYCDKYAAFTIEQARSSGASPERIAEATAQAEQMKRLMQNPLTNAAMALFEPLPVGILAALVSAGILRRK